jgi:hypothetical protein
LDPDSNSKRWKFLILILVGVILESLLVGSNFFMDCVRLRKVSKEILHEKIDEMQNSVSKPPQIAL